MYCINSLIVMKYILTSICKHTRYLNCLKYTYIIRVFEIGMNNPLINNIAGGTVCNLRFTVPTTCSRPSTNLTGLSFFACMRSP